MIDRRVLLSGMASGILAGPALAKASGAASAYDFSFPGLEGGTIRLADYRGRPLLVVNTACECGFTPQFAALQELSTGYKDRGLVVIGVPSGDFGDQEFESAEEIAQFVKMQYGITFPMTAKQNVRGDKAHPFYRWIAATRPADVPRWNFHKILIGRDGQVASVFPTSIHPSDKRVSAAIEAAAGTA